MYLPYISGAGIYDSEQRGFEDSTISELRLIKYYEIEVFNDDYTYCCINDTRIPFTKGTVIIAKPGEWKNSRFNFRCHYIHILITDADLISMLESLPSSMHVSDEKLELYTSLLTKIAEFVPIYNEQMSLKAMGLFMYLLSDLLTVANAPMFKKKNLPNPQKEIIDKVRTLINEHFMDDMSLEIIAQNVHLHPNYLHQIFTSATHETPLAYLTRVRIYHAKYFLLNTTHNITTISEMCGFSSYNYFCTVFKKSTGRSPREYRQSAKDRFLAPGSKTGSAMKSQIQS